MESNKFREPYFSVMNDILPMLHELKLALVGNKIQFGS